jgi:hypothetical protein
MPWKDPGKFEQGISKLPIPFVICYGFDASGSAINPIFWYLDWPIACTSVSRWLRPRDQDGKRPCTNHFFDFP